MAILLVTLAQGHFSKDAEEASYHVYRILSPGILVLCVVFMLSGDLIIWVNWITGFAWRTWLLLYCLPAWIAALKTRTASVSRGACPEASFDDDDPVGLCGHLRLTEL